MSTTIVNEAAAPPPLSPPPVHPPIPLGLSSYVALTGVAGAVAAFILGWWQAKWNLTPDVVALGVTAGGILVSWIAARSHQAAKLIETVKKDLGAVGIEVVPPPPPPK